jgi:hypothetical protein
VTRRPAADRIALATVGGVLVAGVVLILALAARDFRAADNRLHAARASWQRATAAGVSSSALVRGARDAARDATRARDSVARSPWIRVLTAIPLAGRPARWATTATARAASLLDDGARAADHVAADLAAPPPPGPARQARLADVDATLVGLERRLATTDLGGGGYLPPPFSTARAKLRAEQRRALVALGESDVALRGLNAWLAGPSRYLVIAANNAEMRGLGGMALQAGTVEVAGGHLTSGAFRPTEQLVMADSVGLPDGYRQLYGWLDPGREWRNTDTSPDFPVVAPLYATMAASDGFGPVTGVIQLDVVTLRLLLGVVGPVSTGGVTYTADNVGPLVLHDLYVRYAGDEAGRRDVLSGLASAVLDAIDHRSWPADRLATALRQAAAGRHLLVWSSDPVQQRAWQALAVDGRLPPDGLLVTVQNQGANKLDWYLRPSLTLSHLGRRGRLARYRLTVDLALPRTDGQPPYIAGDGTDRLSPGDYRAFVAVYLPGGAVDVRPGGVAPLVAGMDGPLRVVAVRFDVAAGSERSVMFDFSLPAAEQAISLLPDGRWQAPSVRIGSVDTPEDRPVHVSLPEMQPVGRAA